MIRKKSVEGKGLPKKNVVDAPESPKKAVKTASHGQVHAQNYDAIHGENAYEASQRATAKTQAYLKAEAKLRHQTYAEKNYHPKEWTVKIRNGYPFASVILGGFIAFLAGDVFAQGLDTLMYGVTVLTIGILSLAVISLFEVFKYKAAIGVFGHQNYSLTPVLVLFFGISVGISAGGGYLMSLRMNDQTADIQADFSHQTDSIKNQYGEMISAYNTQIESAKETLSKHKNKWLAHAARKDLQAAQAAKADLLQKIKTESSDLQGLEAEEITLADELNAHKAYVVVLLVVVFEILYLLSFGYEYRIERAIKTENRNHGLVKPQESPVMSVSSSPPLSPSVSHLSFEQELILGLLGNNTNISTHNGQFGLGTSLTTSSNKVGFRFGRNRTASKPKHYDDRKLKNADNGTENTDLATHYANRNNGESNYDESNYDDRNNDKRKSVDYSKPVRQCKHCGSDFNYKHWNKQYCSDDCKYEYHRKHNGFDIHLFRQGKAKKSI